MTLNEKLAAFFLARPNRWIDAHELLRVAGFAGWRTRVSDLRKPPFNLQIENRWRVQDGYRISEYRLVPAAAERPRGTMAAPAVEADGPAQPALFR